MWEELPAITPSEHPTDTASTVVRMLMIRLY